MKEEMIKWKDWDEKNWPGQKDYLRHPNVSLGQLFLILVTAAQQMNISMKSLKNAY